MRSKNSIKIIQRAYFKIETGSFSANVFLSTKSSKLRVVTGTANHLNINLITKRMCEKIFKFRNSSSKIKVVLYSKGRRIKERMHYYHYTDPISTLSLSTRGYNALKREGIDTINDLFNCPKEDILKIKNLGKKSSDEIFSIIDELNKNKAIIFSEISPKEPKEIRFFIGSDGHKYNDISIEDLNLSVRAYNCLRIAKINYYSELLLKSADELIVIPNMGKKSLLELENVKSNTPLTLFSEIKDNKYITPDTICRSVFTVISEKINVNPAQLSEKLIPVCSRYMEDKENITDVSLCLKDKNFIKNVYEVNYIQLIFDDYVLNIIKESIYGCEENDILEKMPLYFNNVEFINMQLNNLLSRNEIEIFNNDKFIAVFPSLIIGAQKVLTDKEYDILIQRTKGKTLEDLGKVGGVTKERIRQIEAKAIRKLNNNNSLFKEDIYSDIFKRYSISHDEFMIAFKNTETYNYLALRYSPGKGQADDSRLPLQQILEDKKIPVVFKRACEKAIYKNFVQIAKEYVPCTRGHISNYVLRTFATDEVTFDEFCVLYFSILEDIGKQNDPKLSLMSRGYENKMAASKTTLWKYGKKLRYYNMELYDFTELLTTINLNQYDNIEYSTLKFFRLYPELMKTYDIRDEYELHNLLKKICDKDRYPTINFKRMPHIEFGRADRDNQVMDLLLSLAPIDNNDFAKEYEREYGVAASTVLANYMSHFDQYFYNGVYKIDFPALPDIIARKLKQILIDDFYLLSTIREIYKKEFPKSDEKLLNPFSLKNLGFKVYSNYAVTDKFNTATEYFNYLLTKDDITYFDNIPSEIKGTISFTSQLYRLKAEYEITEFSPNKYINFRKLKQIGITKKMLKMYCNVVLNFVGGSKYFTLSSLRKEGFSHELDELGFDEWFYTSILVEDKNNLSYQRIGGNKLMLSGDFDVMFEDFLEFIVYSQDSLFIDIYELSYRLQEYYNIRISIWKLIEIIKNSTMFYDVVSEKVYADYDIYYEEV
ncbi:DNA-directed RNA polymerase subunit alpha C-terminal domain-containing protein [Neobacillus sp. NPDC093127]|uniref:DNA-directed RNA polymerase subunit alpha C-terminal domain-containing protein n=1 Tax=Neobacillus sp. NPDC093127 TaxID=3364296 RepID=UPI00382899BF